MNIIEALFLGIIQGLTEYLPISSTGHLTVAGKLMNLISNDNPQQWTAFIAVVQLGTLAAVLIYFREDVSSIIKNFYIDNFIEKKSFRYQSLNSKMGWYLVLSTLPVAVIGLLFKDIIEGLFTKNLYVISLSLILLALILALAEKLGKFNRDLNNIKWHDAVIIGLAQSLALIPGASRSGTTITAGLFLGFDRETAARFSFLMSIPAIFASGMLEFYESLKYIDFNSSVNLIAATLSAAFFGYLSIEFLLKYLKRKSTFVFIIYRIVLGIIILLLINFKIIQP